MFECCVEWKHERMFSGWLVLNLPADVVRNLRSIDCVESTSAIVLQAQRVRNAVSEYDAELEILSAPQ